MEVAAGTYSPKSHAAVEEKRKQLEIQQKMLRDMEAP